MVYIVKLCNLFAADLRYPFSYIGLFLQRLRSAQAASDAKEVGHSDRLI
jgi:hypothetical protein